MYHLYLALAPNCDAAEAQHQCFTFIPVINECLCMSELTWIRQGISATLAGWRETGVAPRDQTRLTREERVEISTAWRCRPSTSIELQQQHTHTLRHAHTHRQRRARARTYTDTHTRAHAHTHTRTDTHTRARTHIHTRTDTHTHTVMVSGLFQRRSSWGASWVVHKTFWAVCVLAFIWFDLFLFCHSFC